VLGIACASPIPEEEDLAATPNSSGPRSDHLGEWLTEALPGRLEHSGMFLELSIEEGFGVHHC
jgi:hypothetical protein